MSSPPPGRRPPPSPDAPPSILVPLHRIDRLMTVRVDRRVHGTNSEIGGTAAYKYGMDIHFTVHCEVCEVDVEATGETGGSGNAHRRVHYSKADPDLWWRLALTTVERHRVSIRHLQAVEFRRPRPR